MDAAFQRRKAQELVLLKLSLAIGDINHAKEATRITPAKVALGSVNNLLPVIRDSMVDKMDYVELGLACVDVCSALERAISDRREDQLDRSVLGAIEHLTTTSTEIQKNIVEVGKRSAVSRVLHAKKDKDTIAAWRLDLDRIRRMFERKFPSTEIQLDALDSDGDVSDVLDCTLEASEIASDLTCTAVKELDEVSRGLSVYSTGPTKWANSRVFSSARNSKVLHDSLKQLEDLDKASPEFHQRLRDFLCGERYVFSELQSHDFAWLAEYLDNVLPGISDCTIPAFREFLRELSRICGTEKTLPESCMLSDSLLVVGLDPSASRGAYEGTFDGSKVYVRRIKSHARGDLQQVKGTFHRAVAAWKHLAHRNIVPLLGVTTGPLQLISIWTSDEDLAGYIRNQPGANIFGLLSDVAEGLNYLHFCGVIHGILKGQNVLVDTTGRARITDIGISPDMQDLVSMHNVSTYDMQWAAPETLGILGPHSREADVFSFAGVMIEAFTSTAPFSDKPAHVAMSAIISSQRPPRPTSSMLTEELWILMQRCWDREPQRRPKALEVLSSFDIPAWKCLISRPLSADERTHQVKTLFLDSNETEAAKHLRGDDAQCFVDVIDKMFDTLAPWLQKKCLGVLRKICGQQSLLPKSVHVPHCYDRSGTPKYHGGYADVWKGELDGHPVAVKVLRVYSTSDFEKIKNRCYKEVVTWKSLRHPNVLPLLGVTMDDYHFAMVSEWMINGNINEFIKANEDVNRFELLKDVTDGLLYMHGREMIHGDLKGANILIDLSGHARIADFGLLTIVSDPTNLTPLSSVPGGGTTRWMSPELLHPEQFGFKDSRPTKGSDCYALGMVIFEVLGGQAPFACDKDFIVMRKVLDGERPERPRGVWFTDDLWQTLERCWVPQPVDRPTVQAVFEILGQLSVTWKPLPLSGNGDVEREFNDSRSTMSYHPDK
ncbi:kinase-like domain-containing protein [Thelephora terrestris]|uniref:Kinase-like domain-containing protein n=1 Tax=Thelephora terrestris TaxID=56493 RepID=A0A9P6LDF6_9AGAM|nr:kinase-like domain-containing protein [Thelephora terrestris]